MNCTESFRVFTQTLSTVSYGVRCITYAYYGADFKCKWEGDVVLVLMEEEHSVHDSQEVLSLTVIVCIASVNIEIELDVRDNVCCFTFTVYRLLSIRS